MKISVIAGTLLILIGSVWVSLNSGEVLTPAQIEKVDFSPSDIRFSKENIEFTFTEDEDGNSVKSGVRVPLKYNFPVVSGSGFIVQEIQGYAEMNLDSYNSCRDSGKSKGVCLQEFRDDIEQNIDTFRKNIERDLEELKIKNYEDEINLNTL